jgi:hypothetical protein
VAPHIVEAIVNHSGPAKAGVAGVYNHAVHLEEKRQALDAWAAHILALTVPQVVRPAKPKRNTVPTLTGTTAA